MEKKIEERLKLLEEKIGKVCNTVEMDIRIELREVKKDLKRVLIMFEKVLKYVKF